MCKDDILAQYDNDDSNDELYADLPKGWGGGDYSADEDVDLEDVSIRMK